MPLPPVICCTIQAAEKTIATPATVPKKARGEAAPIIHAAPLMAIAITAQHGAAGQRTEGESAGGQAERERGHGAGLPAGVDAVAVLTGVAAGAWTGCGDNRRVDVLAGLPRLPEYVPGRRHGWGRGGAYGIHTSCMAR